MFTPKMLKKKEEKEYRLCIYVSLQYTYCSNLFVKFELLASINERITVSRHVFKKARPHH